MKRLLRRGVMISVMFLGLALMIGLEVESAQEQLTYVGRVITLYGNTLSVEADNGNIMYFVVGRQHRVYPYSGACDR